MKAARRPPADMTPDAFAVLRQSLGWSRLELARRLSCDETTIRQIEAGKRRVPPSVAAWLTGIADYLARHPAPGDWRVRG